MIKTYYLARTIHKLHIPSFRHCKVDPTARAASGVALTKVTIGRYSYVGNYTHITDAVIGGFCSIGSYCGIGGGIHPTDMVSTSPVFLKGHNILGRHFSEIPYEPSKTVEIGNDVWVGEGVCIMSGVKIGDGAIVGAHAVVTGDVEPYAIVAGIPAKVIRKRFDDETINQLMEIRWWEWSDEKIKQYSSCFDEPKKLVSLLRASPEL